MVFDAPLALSIFCSSSVRTPWVTMKPVAEAVLAGDDSARMRKLLDALDDLDDVQNVYTTAVVET